MASNEDEQSLTQLLVQQRQRLQQIGVPKGILTELDVRHKQVVGLMAASNLAVGQIPFVPVIPRSYLGIYGLAQLLSHYGLAVENICNPSDLSDLMPSYRRPYFIVGVEDGRITKGLVPFEADYRLAAMPVDSDVVYGRQLLTIDEVLALALHTDVLTRHGLIATGSRYESFAQVPGVVIEKNEISVVYFEYYESSDTETIALAVPSCQWRV